MGKLSKSHDVLLAGGSDSTFSKVQTSKHAIWHTKSSAIWNSHGADSQLEGRHSYVDVCVFFIFPSCGLCFVFMHSLYDFLSLFMPFLLSSFFASVSFLCHLPSFLLSFLPSFPSFLHFFTVFLISLLLSLSFRLSFSLPLTLPLSLSLSLAPSPPLSLSLFFCLSFFVSFFLSFFPSCFARAGGRAWARDCPFSILQPLPCLSGRASSPYVHVCFYSYHWISLLTSLSFSLFKPIYLARQLARLCLSIFASTYLSISLSILLTSIHLSDLSTHLAL